MPLKTHQDEQPSLNLTPMIDIVFLLIIFFMVGTEFTKPERSIDVQVPDVSENKQLAAAVQKKVIDVYRDGRVTLDGQFITIDQLVTKLSAARRKHQRLGVLIRGDQRTPHGTMTRVYNACRRAGVVLGVSAKFNQIKDDE